MITTVKQFRYSSKIAKTPWLERRFNFGQPPELLVFFLERLQGSVVRMKSKVDEIPNNILSAQVEGKWSVKENIGHLGEVEEILPKRIDEILNGVPTMSPAVFPVTRDYNKMTIAEVVAFFEESRLATLQVYNTLQPEAYKLTSIHPRFKVPMSTVDLAFFHAEHDDHHLVRMSEIINTLMI